jgi:E3 ubiquitin-protein ligase RAD18
MWSSRDLPGRVGQSRVKLKMDSSSVNALLASGIPDPTDFPQHSVAPGLRQLDMSFRCSICSELFEAPVTLPCGHCFCSIVSPLNTRDCNVLSSGCVVLQCIRGAIGEKQECPSCRKPGNEGHLRTNPVMEEAVTAWKSAR